MSATILVVDDEKNIRRTLAMILKSQGYEMLEAESGEQALEILSNRTVHVGLLDVRLPGMDGLETLQKARAAQPDAVFVMMSGEATVRTAVQATKDGAIDFLEKPLDRDVVLLAVRNALRLVHLDREVRQFRARDADRFRMVGGSEALAKVREQIARVAPTNGRVLILGESGTGKELVARAIHDGSARRDAPFVKVNCAAIPEELIESELFGSVRGAFTGSVRSHDGKFLQADGGTLFLDEVGDMSLRVQAKVLRALQEGEIEKVGGTEPLRVDVRVLAATNHDLAAEVKAGRFREDLFFRLNVVPIRVPPLRERREDIPLLCEHFLALYCRESGYPTKRLARGALEVLSAEPWPGNIRELQNVVERLVIFAPSGTIAEDDLAAAGAGPQGRRVGARIPERAHGPAVSRDEAAGVPEIEEIQRLGGLLEARRLFEKRCIEACLGRTGGNVAQAARLLGLERTNLHKKMRNLGIQSEE
jgi:two-component system nitrogen regulation response regulator NtrX